MSISFAGPVFPSETIDTGWLAGIRDGIQEFEYRFHTGPATYRPGRGRVIQAPNRALDLRFYLDEEGVEILERSSEEARTVVRIALESWGREDRPDRSRPGVLREENGRVERRRTDLIESYDNSPAGLELGWRIEAAESRSFPGPGNASYCRARGLSTTGASACPPRFGRSGVTS
jgi:hypothetical protein